MMRWLLMCCLSVITGAALASDSDGKAAVAPLVKARDIFYQDVALFQAGNLTEDQLIERIASQFAPLLDNRKIALRVMGRFARQASPEQREIFTDRLQVSLVDAYARGLAVYGGEQLKLPDSAVILKPARALVDATLEAPGKESLPIQFALGYDASYGWRVENVVVAGINLGLTLRNQFADLVNTSGSVDGAIEAWDYDAASQGVQ